MAVKKGGRGLMIGREELELKQGMELSCLAEETGEVVKRKRK